MPDWPDFIFLSSKGMFIVKNKQITNPLFSVFEDAYTSANSVYMPFFGLSWNEENIFLGRRAQDKNRDIIEIYSKSFNRLSIVPFFFSDLHQILYYKNTLYITDTGRDCVYKWDEHNIDKVFSLENHQYNRHINSLWFDNNDDLWLACHNWASKNDRNSFCLQLDKSFDIVDRFDIGKDIHNVMVDRNYLYVCDSGNSIFYKINLFDKTDKSILFLSGFCRGLASTEKYLLVGSSPRMCKEQRMETCDCIIYLIDKSSFNIVDKIVFQDIGMSVDLRIVNEPDLAHNKIVLRV